MGKVLTSEQIRGADQYTIENEPILSIDLMERASIACFESLQNQFPNQKSYSVFCGIGNNGGDGLAIARLLSQAGKDVSVYIAQFSEKNTPDFETNLSRLKKTNVQISMLSPNEEFNFSSEGIVIDALLGSGVTRKLSGLLKDVSEVINASGCIVVSVDFPSGLYDQNNTEENRSVAVRANYTFTFQAPKLAFFFKENADVVGNWKTINIGLHPDYIERLKTPFNVIEQAEIESVIHTRDPFSHKGDYGHALIAAGSFGKMGAAVLCSNACLRSGVGLLTVFVPACGYEIIQTAVPEAMVVSGKHEKHLSGSLEIDKYSSSGVGPGVDTQLATIDFLGHLLAATNKPMVLDADALNILSKTPKLWSSVPQNSILTPHPKEFERLFGTSKDSSEQLITAQENAHHRQVIIVLKGKHTAVVFPDKSVYFNTTGNPGMATGGSGDVLTGILTSLLAQGYSPEQASKTGVFIHGFAGDLAAKDKGEEAMVASDIIDYLGAAFKLLHHQE